MSKDKRVCVGVIVGVHGIKGEVKVKSFTEVDTNVDKYGPVEDKSGSKHFDIKVVGHSKELLRVKIKGVDDRTVAEGLKGTEFYVSRDVLPDPEDDEYYLDDLIGLKVMLKSDGTEAGVVSGVYNFGAGDIIEVKDNAGHSEMLPFTKVYVPEVNIKDGYIIVESVLLNFIDGDEGGEPHES